MADSRTIILSAAAFAMAAGLGGIAWSQAQETPAPAPPAAPPGPAFEDFRLILQRNIFDPNRVPPPPPRDPNAPARATPVPTQTVDLLGTWVLSENKVAFINGAPGNDGEAKAGEEIVGFTVASISTNGVELSKADAKLTWPVGSHLVKRGEGEWAIESGLSGAGGGNLRQRNNNNNGGGGRGGNNNGNNFGGGRGGNRNRNNGDANAAAPVRTPLPAASDDAVKRMMEKRRLETEGRGGGGAAQPAAQSQDPQAVQAQTFRRRSGVQTLDAGEIRVIQSLPDGGADLTFAAPVEGEGVVVLEAPVEAVAEEDQSPPVVMNRE